MQRFPPPFPVICKDRQVDPWKIMPISCAPDDVLHVERVTVCQERQTILNADNSAQSFNPGFGQVAGYLLESTEQRGGAFLDAAYGPPAYSLSKCDAPGSGPGAPERVSP